MRLIKVLGLGCSLIFLFGMFMTPLQAVKAADEGIFNRMFAPGPLILGHSKYEGTKQDCMKCHDSGKGVPDSKCLDCHKEIKFFTDRKSGFHGKQTKNCIACHSDHKGRDFESAQIDPQTFDHKQTGFDLSGAHSQIKCMECHKQKRGQFRTRPTEPRYVGAVATCVSCHKKDDIHFYRGEFAKKDCNACHGVVKWKDNVKFDHKIDAKYELQGKHAEISCKKCHNPVERAPQNSVYKWPQLKQKACLNCHQDFHKTNLSSKFQGGACDKCHDQKSWKIEKFRHNITGYELRGKHAELNCIECHKQQGKPADFAVKNFKFTGLKKDCLSCHKDFHRFGNFVLERKVAANQCLTCHDESSWKRIHSFDHNAHTRFDIDGEHKDLKCAECHQVGKNKKVDPNILGVYHWKQLPTKTCETCHESPHIGKFSPQLLAKKCTECHVTSGWKVVSTGKNFDHSKTRFALTGKHTQVSCTQCHVKNKEQVFRWNVPIPELCIQCHTNVHRDQFSEKFHTQSCQNCHDTQSFTKIKPFDHEQTRFSIQGAHKQLKCTQCHTPTDKVFPVKPPHFKNKYIFPDLLTKTCTSCHSDVHRGELGDKCSSCHTEEAWKKTKFNHQTMSRFPLKGKHENLQCSKCHKNETNQMVKDIAKSYPAIHYKPIGMQCSNCHKDPHRGHFGSQCASCHTENGWKTTKDFHKNFSLAGVHFSLQCVECHSQGKKLSGLSLECVICHKKDDVHQGSLPRCGECHRQQVWENTSFKHSLSNFPLRGAHRTLQCMDCHYNGVYQGLSNQCASCHLTQALSVVTPNHSGFANLNSCNECHKNQFTFSSSQ